MNQNPTNAEGHGTLERMVFVFLSLNSAFLIFNGLFMLADPQRWFLVIPGVKFTGGFNQHFIRDIGLIQLLLGVAFVIGMFRTSVRWELWAAATVWLVAHALFHFWEVAVGICGTYSLIQDFPGVTLPALVGIAATAWASRMRLRSPVPVLKHAPVES